MVSREEKNIFEELFEPGVIERLSRHHTLSLIRRLQFHKARLDMDELREEPEKIEMHQPQQDIEADFENSAFACLTLDSQWSIQRANPAAARVLGCRGDFLCGKTLAAFVHTNSVPAFLHLMHNAIKTLKRQSRELKLKTIRGDVFGVRCEIEAVDDGRERPRRFRVLLAEMAEAVYPQG